ncbi:MAG: hypothetical protein DMF51_10285 [Acidobacteria bacterium]|nr:MAG: hypothetical protein DMF51_10285 [Acidobacteriota bacterium]
MVVEDVAPGDRRPVQLEGQDALLSGEPLEPVGVHPRHGELPFPAPRHPFIARVAATTIARSRARKLVRRFIQPWLAGPVHGSRKADQYNRDAGAV